MKSNVIEITPIKYSYNGEVFETSIITELKFEKQNEKWYGLQNFILFSIGMNFIILLAMIIG